MNWDDIKIFTAIAETKGLSKASRELELSHSTVFRRLIVLESEVGYKLFKRDKGRYDLTNAGQELMQLSNPAVNTFHAIERHFISKDIAPRGIVKVTAPASFGYNILSKNIKRFQKSFPDIKLELLISNQEENMNTRKADIAIRVGNTPPEYLVGKQVSTKSWSLYFSKKYSLKNKPLDNPGDLAHHHIIGAVGSLASHSVFKEVQAKYPGAVKNGTDDLIMMSIMAKEGVGVALLPEDLECAGLIKACVYRPARPNKLWVLTHPDLRDSARIKLVMEFLYETLKN